MSAFSEEPRPLALRPLRSISCAITSHPAEFWHCSKHPPPIRERPDPKSPSSSQQHLKPSLALQQNLPFSMPLLSIQHRKSTSRATLVMVVGSHFGSYYRVRPQSAESSSARREVRSWHCLPAMVSSRGPPPYPSLSLDPARHSPHCSPPHAPPSPSTPSLVHVRAHSSFQPAPNPVSTPPHPSSRVIDLLRTVAVADPAADLDHVRHLLPQPSVARHCLVRRLSASRKARLEVPLVALPKCRRRRRRRRRPSSSSAAAAKAPLVCSRGLELASSLRRHLQEASPTLAEQLSFDVSHSPTSHVLRCRHRRPRCSIVVVASFVAFGAAASQAPQLGRRRTRSSIWIYSCVCVCVCICVCVCGAPRRLRRQCVDDSKRRSSTRGIEHDRQAQCRCALSRRVCRLSAATGSPHSDSGHREQLDDAARRGSSVASIIDDIASVIVVSSDTVRAASSVVRESRERLLSITVLDVGRIDDAAAAVFVVGVVGSRGREPGRCAGAVRLQYV